MRRNLFSEQMPIRICRTGDARESERLPLQEYEDP
jgi:hypothetical protein